ncbi:MAG: SDR family oxidoreductase [Candidatus Nitrohelix vancouverensis]|uniref:SDR family oxidoreductase n=1 Tax=Candidatus Nitrohelix vancouverensis TaxID=2705534 RepID=A0A7T0C1X8_9BACT|nr:MAG: SDR family oxidoreductase [Candidatus Nitrohelix vancouverensis]
MNLNLKNRKVVITGVGDGIGREMALMFAAEGAQVAGCSRTQKSLDVLADEMPGEGHCFKAVDLASAQATETFHRDVTQAFGGLDILVNNVGSIQKLATFSELTDADWEEAFQINLMSAVRMCRLFLPQLKESASASILNISSIAGSRPDVIFPHYAAFKAGLSNLTVSLSQTLAPDRIRVNAISPGPVWSRSWENEAAGAAQKQGKELDAVRDEIRAASSESTLLKRMGEPGDVAGLAVFLSSNAGGWITGTNYTVDGGILRNPY